MVGLGIQPLSATAVFMAYEIAALYPEVGRSALLLPLLAAAIMEIAGPVLCRLALVRAGETAGDGEKKEASRGEGIGEFRESQPLTLGVELELQLLSRRDYDLTRGATDLMQALGTTNASARSSSKSPSMIE